MRIAEKVNLVAFIWFTQFIYGCQHFVIAGTISKWYFARDKTKLNSPIKTSFSNLLNFHLGSVCMGAMMITLVKFIKKVFDRRNYFCCCCIFTCIINFLEKILKFFVRNTYIIIARNGTPFIESGTHAFHLIFNNFQNTVAVNFFGDLTLSVARLFIVIIAGFIGFILMVSLIN